MNKFYITTPIYYVNDRPHIGHAYATIAADSLARYHRMLGESVYFLTGTDENAEKNVEAAHQAGVDIFDYVDSMSATWRLTWDELGISNDDFIRTTEDRHRTGVNAFWSVVAAQGDIYRGTYTGLYCVGCEAYYTKSDLNDDGCCPLHLTKPKELREENYFFKLSAYRDRLLQHLADHPDFVQPETRRHEVLNYIRDHLTDMSVSRPNRGWGIPVPGDDTQTIYVWFDALINYLTAIGYGTDQAKFGEWWPASLHVVGKDIIKFHCALWLAMLMSAGLPLPRQVFAHGFFTLNGQKISKSLGNTIDPKDLAETYGLDALRYFLLREISFGGDGDFSVERIAARYDADLASGLGNLASRVTTLADGCSNAKVGSDALVSDFTAAWKRYHAALEAHQPHEAIEVLWNTMKSCDRYIDEKEPWRLSKDEAREEELAIVLGTLIEALRQIAWLLVPLLPDAATKIFTSLGWPQEEQRSLNEASQWGNQASPPQVQKVAPLFPRLGGAEKQND